MELFTHILPQNMVKGDIIRLNTSREGHWNTEMPGKRPESAPTNFGEALNLALGKVNDQLVYADDLAQKMVAELGESDTSLNKLSGKIRKEK